MEKVGPVDVFVVFGLLRRDLAFQKEGHAVPGRNEGLMLEETPAVVSSVLGLRAADLVDRFLLIGGNSIENFDDRVTSAGSN